MSEAERQEQDRERNRVDMSERESLPWTYDYVLFTLPNLEMWHFHWEYCDTKTSIIYQDVLAIAN